MQFGVGLPKCLPFSSFEDWTMKGKTGVKGEG